MLRFSESKFSVLNFTFIILTMLILNGCAAAVVGGAGAAGYYVGKDEREFSNIISDAGITTSINSKLLTSKGVSTFDINIDTFNGVVTVSGHVYSKHIKNKILKLCKETKGVKKVVSKLKIVREN